ncbi:MAG: DNA-3-methyladenine glycosylase [Bacteroidetes bacterium]|nr:DNA-3-methyladenine glycosylase [Bacteroidota bacterium]
MKLKRNFYHRDDVVLIARELLGKYLFTNFNNKLTGGIITETEAYIGLTDRASHSFGGKRTARNEHMYADPGTAYVYICYGIHHLFNVVTNKKDIPDAVLIRAVHPTHGIETILKRRGMKELKKNISGGPGTVGVALGINKIHSGIDLLSDKIWIEDKKLIVDPKKVTVSKRIGVESAGEAAHYPYRFVLKVN